jgi:hypothetical protein
MHPLLVSFSYLLSVAEQYRLLKTQGAASVYFHAFILCLHSLESRIRVLPLLTEVHDHASRQIKPEHDAVEGNEFIELQARKAYVDFGSHV